MYSSVDIQVSPNKVYCSNTRIKILLGVILRVVQRIDLPFLFAKHPFWGHAVRIEAKYPLVALPPHELFTSAVPALEYQTKAPDLVPAHRLPCC